MICSGIWIYLDSVVFVLSLGPCLGSSKSEGSFTLDATHSGAQHSAPP